MRVWVNDRNVLRFLGINRCSLDFCSTLCQDKVEEYNIQQKTLEVTLFRVSVRVGARERLLDSVVRLIGSFVCRMSFLGYSVIWLVGCLVKLESEKFKVVFSVRWLTIASFLHPISFLLGSCLVKLESEKLES
jgi:hypothetical protein